MYRFFEGAKKAYTETRESEIQGLSVNSVSDLSGVIFLVYSTKTNKYTII